MKNEPSARSTLRLFLSKFTAMNIKNYLPIILLSLLLSGCAAKQIAVTENLPPSIASPADAAITKAREAITTVPRSAMGYTNLAASLMKKSRETGDFALNLEAQDAIKRALEISPNDTVARKLEASLHLANHRFTEAVYASKKLIAEFPSDPFAYGVLSDAYVETGDYKQAIDAAQKMVDIRPSTTSYSRVGQLRSLHGDHKGAVKMFTDAARISDPKDTETRAWCLVQLGDEFWKHGKYVEAEKVYDEALQIFPNYFLANVSKGRVRSSVGDLAGAERILLDVLSRVPNAHALKLLGDIAAIQKNEERAKQFRDEFEALEIRLGDAADHNGYGFFLADNGKLEEAATLATDEYAKEPNIKSAHLLAWCHYKNGNIADAEKLIAEAMRLKTNDARMLFHAGMIAKAAGKQAESVRLLRTAIELNPAFDLLKAREAKNVE